MKTLTVVDPSLGTDNLGDEVIYEAVENVLLSIFKDAYIFRVASHEELSDRSYRFLDISDHVFLGGSNMIGSDVGSRTSWRLRWRDVFRLRAIAFGVGWSDYQKPASPKTAFKLNKVLRSDALHSVRDGYTRDHLTAVKVQAINTACPTTWNLTEEHCRAIPRKRAPDAVFTLTAWRRNPDADRALITALKAQYRTVHFFPQEQADRSYFDSFGIDGVSVIQPTLRALDKVLAGEDVDYVGTRLHGGIRALQHRKRTLIVIVDNRAKEMGADIGLPILAREDMASSLTRLIEDDRETAIRVPTEAIRRWSAQFQA